MGKGDRKTKKGKIIKGTFGVRRPKKKSTGKPVTKAKTAADKPKATEKKAAPKTKKATPKKKIEAEDESA